MGLTPIIFETTAELACLSNVTKSKHLKFKLLQKTANKYQVRGRTTSTTGLAQLREVARDNGRGARDCPRRLSRTT
jgi:hypothetical protein